MLRRTFIALAPLVAFARTLSWVVAAVAFATLPLASCGPPKTPDPTPTFTPSPLPPPDTPRPTSRPTPEFSFIPWDQASAHVGEYGTVCGPVVTASYRPDVNGGPTWLNVGRDFPDQNRFQVVIWQDDRGNFPQTPESYYPGHSICVTGNIESYRGVAEILISSPASISLE